MLMRVGLYLGHIGSALAKPSVGMLESLHGVTMGFNRRLLSRCLAVLPLVTCSTIGSCLQSAFAAALAVCSN